MVSIDTNIQAVKYKRFIWGRRGRRLINRHIDTSKIYLHRGP